MKNRKFKPEEPRANNSSMNKNLGYREQQLAYFRTQPEPDVFDPNLPEFRKPKVGDTWGQWVLQSDNILEYMPIHYQIGQERGGISFWIFHCSEKAFINAEQLGHLIYAMRDCGWRQ